MRVEQKGGRKQRPLPALLALKVMWMLWEHRDRPASRVSGGKGPFSLFSREGPSLPLAPAGPSHPHRQNRPHQARTRIYRI